MLSRFFGLLGTSHLPAGTGLLIHPSQGVHTFGMLYPIDVIFLNKARQVVGVRGVLKPFRVTAMNWSAHSVLELPAKTIAASQTELDDQLEFFAI